MAQFCFISGLHHHQVRYGPHHGNIEEAVVCGPVIRRESGAVHAEPHGQFLQGCIVLNHIHTSLHECGVYRQIRLESLRSLAAGKECGVFLCYAYIKIPLRELVAENIQACAGGHGSGNGGDIGVTGGQRGQVRAESFGIGDNPAFAGAAVLNVVLADAVELGRVGRGRFIPATLLGNHMDNDRAFVSGGNAQRLFKTFDIVTIHRPVIAEAQLLEKAQRGDDAVRRADEPGNLFAGRFSGHFLNDGSGIAAQPGVGISLLQRGKVSRERAHIAVNAPLIIIEDEDELARGCGNAVEPFQRGAAGKGAISHYGDNMVIITC